MTHDSYYACSESRSLDMQIHVVFVIPRKYPCLDWSYLHAQFGIAQNWSRKSPPPEH